MLALLLFIANDRAWHIWQSGRAQGYQEGYQQGIRQPPQVWKSST